MREWDIKQDRIRIANETLRIISSGSYTVGNRMYRLNTDADTELITNKRHDEIKAAIESMQMNRGRTKAKADVIIGTTLKGIYQEAKAIGNQNTNQIGVLNFASAKNPGGGFLKGSMAQEESLAYSSNLYLKLSSGQGAKFYSYNKSHYNPFYTDSMLISNVTFFRDDSFNFVLNPVTVTVVTSPAVNTNIAYRDGKTRSQVNEVMYGRMEKILRAFVYRGCRVIILGAFGCGVFKNEPEDIANIWYDLLNNRGYNQYFDRIVFYIKDRGMANIFENKLA